MAALRGVPASSQADVIAWDTRALLAVTCRCLARASFRSQALEVFVECLLCGLTFPHGLLGIGAALRISGFPFFRGKRSG